MGELLSKSELAARLNIHINTVDLWRKEGMPEVKLGKPVRFDYDKVLEWASNRSGRRVNESR